MLRSPPVSTPFPYTTLFRSTSSWCRREGFPGKAPRGAWPFGQRGQFVDSRRSAQLSLAREFRARPAGRRRVRADLARSEEHTSELQSRRDRVCRLLLEKKKR